MATYRLVSVKGTVECETVECETLDEALAAARRMDADLQPAFGVTIEDETGRVRAEVDDERTDTDFDD